MKQIVIITLIILVLITACIGGLFWWQVLLDPQRPEFVPEAGTFVSGPMAEIQNSILTITWATQDEYQINQIYFRKPGETYPSSGGGTVNVTYDTTDRVYRYSIEYNWAETLNEYSYQVWGDTSDHSKHIASRILDL